MFVETKTMRKAIADAFLTPTKHIRNVSPNPSSIRCPALSSDLIHRFAGMPPFLCFDPNQSNLQFTTLSSRLRQFHLVIDPDLSLRFLFPSSFLTLPETPSNRGRRRSRRSLLSEAVSPGYRGDPPGPVSPIPRRGFFDRFEMRMFASFVSPT